jgi:hypothetical protein
MQTMGHYETGDLTELGSGSLVAGADAGHGAAL